MPLHDAFGKKVGKTAETAKPNRAKNLSKQPTIDDLMECLTTVQETIRQPLILTWKRPDGIVCLLTVIRTAEDYQPTWTLHEDHEVELAAMWTYSTSDTELIHNMLSQQSADPAAPAAVIPESLRPKVAETAPGQPQFFENYEIINTIGHGGMGIIYKARDRNDGNFVALKVLRADLMVDPSNVERFKHEASAVSQLQHNNLIGLREFGLSRFGQPFLAMDYLEGVELKAVLQAHGHLDTPTFINIFTQLCEALAYAHDQGIIHRDLKPNNIMLVKSPNGKDTVKIIDFGIAKSVAGQPTTVSLTTYGQFLGSPAYMSPEQCGGAQGNQLDSRSDIYSLGCVMYEAITGRLPFLYDNVLKTILAQVNENPQPFKTVRPDLQIPPVLEDIIFVALQKNPDDRYQTARDLWEDLWAFAGGSSQSRGSGVHEALPVSLLSQATQKDAAAAQPSRQSGPFDVVQSAQQAALRQSGSLDAMQSAPQAPSRQSGPFDAIQSAPQAPSRQSGPFDAIQSAPQTPSRQSGPFDAIQSAPQTPSRQSGPFEAVQNSSGHQPGQFQPPPQTPDSPLSRVIKSSPSMRTPSTYLPAYKAQPGQPGQQGPRIPHRPPPPPTTMKATQPLVDPVLSEQAFKLLRYANILDDDVLQALRDCLQTLENGDISFEQAVAILQHAKRKPNI